MLCQDWELSVNVDCIEKYEPGKTSFDTKEFVYDTVEKKVYDLEFENQDYSPARSMRMGGVLSALPENVFSIRGILTVYWICWRKES